MQRAAGKPWLWALVMSSACALENPSTIVPTPDAGQPMDVQTPDVGLVCLGGQASCDGDDSNGCETDLRTSLQHCGRCNAACETRAMGTAACTDGRCVYTCADGFGDCDNNPTNGCETNLRTSPQHCGMCGRTCTAMGASAVCTAGACTTSNCMAGFGDCDGNTSNGCETLVTSSVQHCGACGNACMLANATPVCSAGTCGILSCNEGFATCDGMAANGCETDTRTSVQHCGACGNACPSGPGATASCAGGMCTFACAAGFANCDGNNNNGCEASLNAPATCGACNAPCTAPANGTAACTSGTCVRACNAGFVMQGAACVACGGAGQPVCGGGTCTGRTVNVGGMCVACGAAAQPVCAGNSCDAGLVAVNNVCTACGNAGQAACPGTGCAAGTILCGSTCVNNGYDNANCGTCGTVCGSNCNFGSCNGRCGVMRTDVCCTSGTPCAVGTATQVAIGGGRMVCVCR